MNNNIANGDVTVKRKGLFRNILIFLAIFGPGIITASAGNDAGGITTYSVAGAEFGYSILWAFLPMLLPLIVVQEMCARMGAVTGKGLADLIREKFGVKVTFYAMALFLLSAFTNTLSEFSGIAASGEIFGIPRFISLPVAAVVVWWVVVKGTYKSVEKVFFVGVIFYAAYIATGFMVHPDWGQIGKGMVMPEIEFSRPYLIIIMGVVGTTIAPWMQFYQQSTVVEKGISVKDYKYLRIDIILGAIVMIAVAAFIVIACAGTLFKNGVHISTAKDAALALKPIAGRYCSALFAFGLLNASLFAAVILPLATSYSICEGLGWEAGIDKRFKDAPQFYSLFTLMILAASLIIMIPRVNLVKVMIFSQVANSVFLPFVLVFSILLINDKHLMGEYKNSSFFNIVAWVTVAVLILMTIGLTITLFLPR